MGILGDTFEKENNDGFYERSETIGLSDEVSSQSHDIEPTYRDLRMEALPDKESVVDLLIDILLDADILENKESAIINKMEYLSDLPMHILKEIINDLEVVLSPEQAASIDAMIKMESPNKKPRSNLQWRTPSY